MSLLKFTRKKRIVPISATTDIVVVDRNGYIGEKRPNGNTVYFGYLDSFADYSQAGLGQVTIIPVVIGKVTIGGREYKTTKIGNQEWLAENLDYKFDVNGSQIPIGGNYDTEATPHAWYYNNNETDYGINGTYKCGLLYNWYAAKYLEDNKNTLLPSGWHVPTKSEVNSLLSSVGSSAKPYFATNNSVTSNFPQVNGIDSISLSLLPSGDRYTSFRYMGSNMALWLASQVDGTGSCVWYALNSGDSFHVETGYSNSLGYSLRLVKDAT